MEANEGWTWLSNSRKWHYFRDSRSLCGKFALLGIKGFDGDLERGNNESPDNCAGCRKKLKQEIKIKEATHEGNH